MACLTRSVCSYMGVRHAFFLENGRGAMSLLLQVLAEDPKSVGKNTVVLPSYTCYSVVASVLQTGLVPLVCDIDAATLTFDAEQLKSIDFAPVLAIVSSNLYGIPDDLAVLQNIAIDNNVFLVDDAAQCLGGRFSDRPVGSFGDAGILSFDKGKVITSINGGVIVTNDDDIASRLANRMDAVPTLPVRRRVAEAFKSVAYAIFLNPHAYWLPNSLAFLKLGQTCYDESFPVRRYCEELAPIALAQLNRLDVLNQHRRRCAQVYAEYFRHYFSAMTFEIPATAEPIFLRFPLRISSPAARDEIIRSLTRFGASLSYPASIVDIPQVRDRIHIHNSHCSSGRQVAEQLITLPTHPFVKPRDLDTITRSIGSILDAA